MGWASYWLSGPLKVNSFLKRALVSWVWIFWGMEGFLFYGESSVRGEHPEPWKSLSQYQNVILEFRGP